VASNFQGSIQGQEPSGGAGPAGVDVSEHGTPKVSAALVLNFIAEAGVTVEVTEAPPGTANIDIAGDGLVFGQDYRWVQTEEEVTSANANWQNVAFLRFVAIGGLYRLAWSTEADSNGTYIDMRLRWLKDGQGPMQEIAHGEVTAGALHDPHAGIAVGLELGALEQVFEFDIRSGGPPTSVGARRTRIDIWKVGEI
jgi:hypothetical protein